MSGAITLKLTSLLIRTVSKPIANTIKAQSKQSNFLKTNFIRFGQFINRMDLTLRNTSNSKLKIRPLNDNKAIEIGSNFLSELFVFSIAAGLIIYELTRSKKDKEPSEKVEAVAVPPPVPALGPSLGSLVTPATPTTPTPTSQQLNSSSNKATTNEINQTITNIKTEIAQLKQQNSLILQELDKLKHIEKSSPPVNNREPVNKAIAKTSTTSK